MQIIAQKDNTLWKVTNLMQKTINSKICSLGSTLKWSKYGVYKGENKSMSSA